MASSPIDELLALIYLLLLDEENLTSISNSQSSLPSRSKLATELVGQVLVVLLRSREQEYATSLEEDQQILLSENLPHRTAMAIQVRMGEKKVLRAAIQEASSFGASNKKMRDQVTTEVGTKKRGREETSSSNKKGRKR